MTLWHTATSTSHATRWCFTPRVFAMKPRQKLCWASAFFKSGGNGSLDLAGQMTLAPQAVLLVKRSKWTAPSDYKPPQALKVWAMDKCTGIKVEVKTQLATWCWRGSPCFC